VSYSNQAGYGEGPVTGGLFLGDDASSALTDTSRFAVTQDQRNTVRARVRMQTTKRTWIALSGDMEAVFPWNSNEKTVDLLAQYGPEINRKSNFARGQSAEYFSDDFGPYCAAGRRFFRRVPRKDRFHILHSARSMSASSFAFGRAREPYFVDPASPQNAKWSVNALDASSPKKRPPVTGPSP